MNKKLLALLLAAAMSTTIMTACKKNSDTDTETVDNSAVESTTEDPLGVEWPSRGAEMKDIIDAIIMAKTENPDIEYDMNDPESFWTFVYYVLVKSGTYCNLAEATGNDGEYKIGKASVKLYAREVFYEYKGVDDLPAIPDGFEGISYDESSDSYIYKDRGITLGLSEVYACGDKQDDNTYITVSYMIDGSDADNTEIVPWKVTMIDIRTSDDDSPLYAYQITDIEEVTDF